MNDGVVVGIQVLPVLVDCLLEVPDVVTLDGYSSLDKITMGNEVSKILGEPFGPE
jgi:hypothetical protein